MIIGINIGHMMYYYCSETTFSSGWHVDQGNMWRTMKALYPANGVFRYEVYPQYYKSHIAFVGECSRIPEFTWGPQKFCMQNTLYLPERVL